MIRRLSFLAESHEDHVGGLNCVHTHAVVSKTQAIATAMLEAAKSDVLPDAFAEGVTPECPNLAKVSALVEAVGQTLRCLWGRGQESA